MGHPGAMFLAQAQGLCDLLPLTAERVPRTRHLGWRTAGCWRWWSTEDLCREVRRAALGLYELGIRPGSTVGIVGPSTPSWIVADLAVLSLGAVSVPLHTDMTSEHAAYEINHARLRALLALDDGGASFAAQYCGRCAVVVEREVTRPGCYALSWEEMCRSGDELGIRDPTLFPRLLAGVTRDRLATIVYTCSTSGMPNGIELTHGALLSQIEGALSAFPLDPARDRALSCLPLAQVFERMMCYAYLAAGIPVWFADDMPQVGLLMREAEPTIMSMVPSLIEKLYEGIAQKIDAEWLGQRTLGRWALRQAVANDPDVPESPLLRLSDGLVLQKVRAALGGSLRQVIVGGAALDPRFERILRNIGVPLSPAYGLTETGPVVAVNCDGGRRWATVGRPIPGVLVRISAAGEIQVRGPGQMRGYHRDPELTRVAFTADGWMRTGDHGLIDADGFLVVTGRSTGPLKSVGCMSASCEPGGPSVRHARVGPRPTSVGHHTTASAV
jgi:long-chain acyl-CoA synthetase